MNWICQAHNRKKCQAVVNTENPVTSLLCTIMWEISSPGEKLIAFQEFSSMELVSRMLSSGMQYLVARQLATTVPGVWYLVAWQLATTVPGVWYLVAWQLATTVPDVWYLVAWQLATTVPGMWYLVTWQLATTIPGMWYLVAWQLATTVPGMWYLVTWQLATTVPAVWYLVTWQLATIIPGVTCQTTMLFTVITLRILNLMRQFKLSSCILTNVVISAAMYIRVIKQRLTTWILLLCLCIQQASRGRLWWTL